MKHRTMMMTQRPLLSEIYIHVLLCAPWVTLMSATCADTSSRSQARRRADTRCAASAGLSWCTPGESARYAKLR